MVVTGSFKKQNKYKNKKENTSLFGTTSVILAKLMPEMKSRRELWWSHLL